MARALAASLTVMLTGSACVGTSSEQGPARTVSPAQKSAAQALPTDKEALARFYSQDPVSYTHLTLPTNREV